MLIGENIGKDYTDKISKIQNELDFLDRIYVIEEKNDEIVLAVRIKPSKSYRNHDESVALDKDEELNILKSKAESIFGKKLVILKSAIEEVNYVLNKISDYLKSHGGSVKVKEVNEEKGEVIVSLQGACALCPSAIVTMKAGIRRTLSRYIPWIKKVESAEKPVEPNFNFKLAPKPQK